MGEYFNSSLHPEVRHLYVSRVLDALEGVNFDTIVVRGNSGTTIGSIVAHHLGCHLYVVRKHREDTHAEQDFAGSMGCRYVILDDFISSGRTITAIRENVLTNYGDRVELVGITLYRDTKKDHAKASPHPEYTMIFSAQRPENQREFIRDRPLGETARGPMRPVDWPKEWTHDMREFISLDAIEQCRFLGEPKEDTIQRIVEDMPPDVYPFKRPSAMIQCKLLRDGWQEPPKATPTTKMDGARGYFMGATQTSRMSSKGPEPQYLRAMTPGAWRNTFTDQYTIDRPSILDLMDKMDFAPIELRIMKEMHEGKRAWKDKYLTAKVDV